MNLATTLEIRAYGTSEGVTKAWDTRGRQQQSYDVAKGVPWETASGYATKTGSKEAMQGLLRVDYFAKKYGFKKLSGSEASRGTLWMKEPSTSEYGDAKGNRLIVTQHPDKNVVTAHVDADEATHSAFNKILGAKNFSKMQYEMYRDEYVGSPLHKSIVGSIEIYAQQQTICLDYDDTLVEGPYVAGKAGKLDPEGVKLAKWIVAQGCALVVLTAQPASEWKLIGQQLAQVDVNVSAVTNRKPPSSAYVDNRGVHWTGSAARAIKKIKPLMKAA